MDTAPQDGPVFIVSTHNVFHLSADPVVLEGNGEAGELGPTAGGEAGRLEYTVTGGYADSDGDGLPDPWEIEGADVDCDGDVDVDLPAMGADPDHKDLFVEMDWQTANLPSRDRVLRVKEAFARAPLDAGGIANPDGQPGINLWVDTGSLSEDAGLVGDDFGGGNAVSGAIEFCTLDSDNDGNGTPDFYETKAANFDSARARIFRYVISVRNIGGCAGGWGELGGNDMLIINTGDFWASTFMHELGHTMNLGHGGNDGNSCKPNYVSVMSYNYSGGIPWVDYDQTGGGESHLDYSPPLYIDVSEVPRRTDALPDLDEANLDETVALSGNPILEFRFTDAHGRRVSQPLTRRADWNGDGDRSDTGISVNIDDDGSSGPDACDNASADSVIKSHDDWNKLSMPFQHFGASDDGPVHDHTDPTTLEIVLLELAVNTTDLAVDASGPDTAVAGTTITYDVTVTNEGPNDADNTVVADTLPAGTTFNSGSAGCSEAAAVVTCDLGVIESGASANASITLSIDPAYVADAGVSPAALSNSIAVANGVIPDSDDTDNSDTHVANVTAEVDLTLAKSADADTVAAGTSVTYTLDAGNDGPSVATSVSVQDTLPAGLTYVSDSGDCSEAAGLVTCDVADLAPGGSASIEITADVAADLVHNAGGPVTLTNTASADSDGAETDAEDNGASLDTEVIASADLEVLDVTAVDPPALLILGTPGSLTLRATVTNNGPSAPIDALLDVAASASAGASAGPAEDSLAVDALELHEERDVERTFEIECTTPGTKTFTLDAAISPASEDDEDSDADNSDGSVDLQVECVVPVRVVVNPGGDPASVLNLMKGSIPVAVLTTTAGEFGLAVAFDATLISPASVRFGPGPLVLAGGGAAPNRNAGGLEDARAPVRDGDFDMVMQFRAHQTGLVAGDSEGCAFGTWSSGGAAYWFFGCGPIRTTR